MADIRLEKDWDASCQAVATEAFADKARYAYAQIAALTEAIEKTVAQVNILFEWLDYVLLPGQLIEGEMGVTAKPHSPLSGDLSKMITNVRYINKRLEALMQALEV